MLKSCGKYAEKLTSEKRLKVTSGQSMKCFQFPDEGYPE